jgi:teichuronic acid exporter
VTRRRLGNALAWSFVLTGGRQLINTVVLLVLAGLLGPTAFGVIAMASVFILLVQTVLTQGFVAAIIQREDLEEEHLDSMFWVALGLSVAMALPCIALSGVWADINRTPELQPVLIALSALIPIQGLVTVQEAILRREMRFRALAVRTNGSLLVGGAVGIALAFAGAGTAALVAQQLVQAVVALVMLWAIADWRPHLRFSWVHAKPMLGFAGTNSVATVGIVLSNRADALVIGLFFGPAAVGLYRFGSRFVDMGVDVLVRSLQAVSLPELSRLQRDKEAFASRLQQLLQASSLLCVPTMAVIAACAMPFIDLMGSEWSAAATPMVILCLAGAVRSVVLFTGPMLQALGRPRALVVLVWVATVLSLSSFVIAGVLLEDESESVQVIGMAVASVVYFAVFMLPINIWVLARAGGLPARTQLATITPVFIASTIAAMVGLLLDTVLDSLNPVVRLLLVGSVTAVTVIGLVLVLEPAARDHLSHLRDRLRARRRRDVPTATPAPTQV